MKKQKISNERAITLVALVITIIVLLILAGVTLNIVLNSGIINKSQTAVSKYNEQATKEKLTLALTEYKFKQLAGDSQSLESIIQNIGGEVTEGTDSAATEWTIELDGYIFTVDKKTNGITSIEPSNSTPLEAPEIETKTFTLASNSQSATIKVTATAKNGGTLTVTIDNKTATLVGSEYTMEVDKNGDIEIKVTETVGNKTKTTTSTINVTGIQVPKYTVTLTNGSGISSVKGGGEVEKGQSVTISATVETGKVFAGWKVEPSENASNVADLTANPTTVTPTGNITISCTAAVAMPVPTEATGYVGCYADFDGNPGVDGIIYADLLVGAPTGDWYDSNGTYTIPPSNYGLTAQNVKTYVVSSTPVVDSRFDTTARYVVSPASGTSGNDRFYVMGLEDITGTEGTTTLTTLYWYKSAYRNMPSTPVTSTDFGAGKDNTTTILGVWEKGSGTGGYGAQDNRDMWKWIKVKTGETNEGWFVPSRGEWAAFAKAFSITLSNYNNFRLGSDYWSSSQDSNSTSWLASFGNGYTYAGNINCEIYVRLSATF